ncbi:MAG: hypothetical protein IT267_08375 [Saprospiraceae bacterium]|nr:hypothetical protein [Saprospiraceae bacterium]
MNTILGITCDISWWLLVLSWLIPFLLGYLIGRMMSSGKTEGNSLSEGKGTDLIGTTTNSARDKLRLNQRNLDLEQILVNIRKQNLECERKNLSLESELSKYKEQLRKEQNKESSISSALVSSDLTNNNNNPSNQSSINEVSVDRSDSDSKIFENLSTHKLQIFEGLGPLMEKFLNSIQVFTWQELSEQDASVLKVKLENLDPKYRILDPGSWPIQAKMAVEGRWKELIEYQKKLSYEKSKEGKIVEEAKVEKIVIKMGLLKKYSKDDLTAIEGIGPKIEKLLQNGGVKSWKELSTTKVEFLKSLLIAAGERFQLADPTTWPYQADLAEKGKWKELFEYQDTLKGGKLK